MLCIFYHKVKRESVTCPMTLCKFKPSQPKSELWWRQRSGEGTEMVTGSTTGASNGHTVSYFLELSAGYLDVPRLWKNPPSFWIWGFQSKVTSLIKSKNLLWRFYSFQTLLKPTHSLKSYVYTVSFYPEFEAIHKNTHIHDSVTTY